ncbi:MAG: hypothetical protein ACE361_08620 [Aureliella sp.]
MFKDLVRALDYSDCAEAALILFVLAFGVILFGALRLSRNATNTFSAIPLEDEIQDPRH